MEGSRAARYSRYRTAHHCGLSGVVVVRLELRCVLLPAGRLLLGHHPIQVIPLFLLLPALPLQTGLLL